MADEQETEPVAGMPTEEQLREALDRVGVSDVLLNAASAAASLGFRRVSAGGSRPAAGQARDRGAARARARPKEGGVDEAVVRDLEQARLNLQLAYAKAIEEGSAGS